ncbi:MAG: lamin tail domain-containing protein [Bacteroidota bacterium]
MMAMIERYLKPAVHSPLRRHPGPRKPAAIHFVYFLIGFFALSAISLNGWGQTLFDTYSDGNFTTSPVWGGNTTYWTIDANSTAAAGATGSNTLRLNGPAVAETDYLSSQVSDWGTSQEWNFFIGRRAQAFTAANQAYFWLYANEATLNNATVDGYRIAIGDDTGVDDIRLEYVVNGAVSSTVITSSGGTTNAITDIGFLIRVTRSSVGAWAIYTSTLPTANGTGAIASDVPSAANTTVSQGSATNNTLVPATNGYLGVAALHSTGANAIISTEFDQVYFTPTSACTDPTTQATIAAFGTVTNNSIVVNWTRGGTPGDGVIVVARAGGAPTDPADGISYTASATFSSGTDCGSGSYVVFLGSGTSVTVTGLTASTTYYFEIFEKNCTGTSIKINTTSPGNGSQATSASSYCSSDLIISEYIEGSSNNKYIEIYNGTSSSVDLSNYKLQCYSNGSGTPSNDVTLSGTLTSGSTIIYENSGEALGVSGTSNTAVGFNGDDAVALYKISTTSYVDIFGRIGEDPGSAWISASNTTVDKTLVRKSTVTGGITTNPGSGFPTLESEWTQYNIDDVTHLGSHTMSCGPTLLVSPSSLTGFSYMLGYGPSSNQTYSLSGVNLTGSGNITVTGSTNYEVSTNGSSYSSSVTFAYASGIITGQPKTVYVRLKAGLSVGNYNSETVTNAGGGATTVNVTCSGTVTAVSTWFIDEGFDNVTDLSTLASTTSPSWSGSVASGGILDYQGPTATQLWNRNANSLEFNGVLNSTVTITSPTFSNADLLSFWYHQSSSASPNTLLVEQNDGTKAWTTLITITGDVEPRVYFYALAANIIQVRFTYTTSNATYWSFFDDVRIRRSGTCTDNLQILQTLIYSCGGDEGINESVVFKTGSSPVDVDDLAVSFPSVGTGGTEYSMESAQKFVTNPTYVASLNALAQVTYPTCTPVLEPPSGIIPANSYAVVFTGSSPTVVYDFSAACPTGRTYYAVFCDNTNTSGRYDNDPSGAMEKWTALIDMSTGCYDAHYYDAGFNEAEGGLANYAEGTEVRTYENWGCEIVLPIELESFSAYCEDNDVLIQWVTASETNNDYFTIEKSSDLIFWETVAKIAGAGNSNESLTYTYSDINSFDGTFYYRLKQTDYNGGYEYFTPIAVSCDQENNFMLNLYPNPAASELKCDLYCSEESAAVVEIINTFGQKVYGQSCNLQKGINNFGFDISGYTSGLYFFKIYTADGRVLKTKSFAKQ